MGRPAWRSRARHVKAGRVGPAILIGFGRTLVIAAGARYRRPPIADLATFEGNGVSYWASPIEAKLCQDEEIALVGRGNSAGQAVVYLAGSTKKLHLVIRGRDLAASMSHCLVDRIGPCSTSSSATRPKWYGSTATANAG